MRMNSAFEGENPRRDKEAAVSYSLQAAVTKSHRLGGLETTELDFSQFWRLGGQDQGPRRFGM